MIDCRNRASILVALVLFALAFLFPTVGMGWFQSEVKEQAEDSYSKSLVDSGVEEPEKHEIVLSSAEPSEESESISFGSFDRILSFGFRLVFPGRRERLDAGRYR